ncbi:DNA polymerase IV [Candidatus Micrarchaeota archaeon]|nr:DNA polymerase IV [Candidatus Micrarchaeota archaeon]
MYLHLDMDYFFAQLEEKRRPMSAGKIIVVCVYSGRTPDSGVVSTVNYPGRALGIHSGMPIAFAKKRAPPADTIFIPVDHEHYARMSAQIDSVVRGMCAKAVQASIDEWNVEDNEAAKKAPRLKDGIRAEFGLSCSVGVAPSLLGAKMAASKSKPDGLLVLDADAERAMIGGSDVEKVPGIGPKTSGALRAMGAQNVRDIAKLGAVRLVEAFGRKTGAWLHDLGNGRYDSGLGEEKEQGEVSRIGTLKEKTRDPYMLLSRLEELESEGKERLLHMKKSYRTLSLIFVTEDLRTHAKSMSFRNPRGWNEDIRAEKEALVREFLAGNALEVRRIGIRFANFLDLGGQTTLF